MSLALCVMLTEDDHVSLALCVMSAAIIDTTLLHSHSLTTLDTDHGALVQLYMDRETGPTGESRTTRTTNNDNELRAR